MQASNLKNNFKKAAFSQAYQDKGGVAGAGIETAVVVVPTTDEAMAPVGTSCTSHYDCQVIFNTATIHFELCHTQCC